MSDDGASRKIEVSLVKLKETISFNIKRGFYHLRDSCSNFLNKIIIISAENLSFGINFKGISLVESKMISSIEFRGEISFYMKELTFFKLV